ncbi:MAG: glutaredoxin family protein [Pseudomonadota bacterium]
MKENKTVKLFALSTCIHCRHARTFLEDNGAELDVHYVDLLSDDERDVVLYDMRRYNEALSFPTMVFADGTVVIGFQEDAMREALGL